MAVMTSDGGPNGESILDGIANGQGKKNVYALDLRHPYVQQDDIGLLPLQRAGLASNAPRGYRGPSYAPSPHIQVVASRCSTRPPAYR
jgi:hypothetical protein